MNLWNFLRWRTNQSPFSGCDISIDIETNGLSFDAEIISAAIAYGKIGSGEIKTQFFFLDKFNTQAKRDQIEFQKILDFVLFNPQFCGRVVFHNANFDLVHLIRRYSRTRPSFKFTKHLAKIHDTQVLSRCLHNNKYVGHADPKQLKCHSLKYLAKEHLGIDHQSFEDVSGGQNIRLVSRSDLATYNQKDAELTLRLFWKLFGEITPATQDYYDKIEQPFTIGICALNYYGVPFDQKSAHELANLIRKAQSEFELKIYKKVGRKFNLRSGPELSKNIFYNSRLRYRRPDGLLKPLSSLYLTTSGRPKTDLEHFVKIRESIVGDHSDAIEVRHLINNVIIFMELSQAYEEIEKLLKFAHHLGEGKFRIYPSFSVDAKTGRVKCGSPNLLGTPKQIFDKSIFSESDNFLGRIKVFNSIRGLISVTSEDVLLSIDISGLDLGVIAAGLSQIDSNTYWLDCFKKFGPRNLTVDTHLALLRRISPARYKEALDDFAPILPQEFRIEDLFVTKLSNGERTFIEMKSDREFAIAKDRFPEGAEKRLNDIRSVMKTTNLSIPYNQGALKLATDLSALGIQFSAANAQQILNEYHQTFPEIRKYQDQLANAVYHLGYYDTPFGRRIFSDVWDELNSVLNNEFEFVVCVKSKYWYLKVRNWEKACGEVFQSLKITKDKNIFSFKEIVQVTPLDPRIFREKKTKSFSVFTKKSESNTNEQSSFALSNFEITFEIDQSLHQRDRSDEANNVTASMMMDGRYEIPQNSVVFYRVNNGRPASRFFRKFKPLSKVAKSFFAIYCQSEAAIIAKMCFNEIFQRVENETDTAQMTLFIHDQYAVAVQKSEKSKVTAILGSAIERPKPMLAGRDYPIVFAGEVEDKGQRFS